MTKPARPPKLSRDTNRRAYQVVAFLTGTAPPPKDETPKDARAVSRGRRGGLKGGNARAAKLSPERRKEIAEKAAAARWHDRR